MRPSPEVFERLAVRAMLHRDRLAELAQQADYADVTAPAPDPARREAARQLSLAADAAELLFLELDDFSQAWGESLADAAEAAAQHPAD